MDMECLLCKSNNNTGVENQINPIYQAGIQNACFSTATQTHIADRENPAAFVNFR